MWIRQLFLAPALTDVCFHTFIGEQKPPRGKLRGGDCFLARLIRQREGVPAFSLNYAAKSRPLPPREARRASYAYDWAHRLTNANNAGANVGLWYDPDGNRIKKVTASTTNLYLVATVNPTGYPQVVEESVVNGATTNLSRAYTWGLDLVAQRKISGAYVTYYGTDGLG